MVERASVMRRILSLRCFNYLPSLREDFDAPSKTKLMSAMSVYSPQELENLATFTTRLVKQFGHKRIVLFPDLFTQDMCQINRDNVGLAIYLLNAWLPDEMTRLLEYNECLTVSNRVPQSCSVPTCTSLKVSNANFCDAHVMKIQGLEVKRESGSLFAARDFQAPEIICEVFGETIGLNDFHHQYSNTPNVKFIATRNYAVVMSNPLKSSIARHVTHSLNGNCELKVTYCVNNDCRLHIVALRPIAKGEMIAANLKAIQNVIIR